MSGSNEYIGKELEIFAHAKNWKSYYGSLIKPHFGKRVLEVGAGLGATTLTLYDKKVTEWICLEPDNNFYQMLEKQIQNKELPEACNAIHGTLSTLDAADVYNTIIYIDVLEHIEHDKKELQNASAHLKPGGKLIVLSPAHQWLFSPFDREIGHFRRYSRGSLAQAGPENCTEVKNIYLDSAGMMLSLANKLLLQQSMPTVKQILFWDRWIVPVSRILDRVLFFNLGKSVVGIWERN
jgi:ubiquinone/menaquinone biosynthesis C-methylase UbiE